jgi:hypothetical protein
MAVAASNASVPGSGTGASVVGVWGNATLGGAKTAPGPAPLPIVKLDPASSEAAPSKINEPLFTNMPPPNDRLDVPLMLEGAVPSALLALAIEGLFELIERSFPRHG